MLAVVAGALFGTARALLAVLSSLKVSDVGEALDMREPIHAALGRVGGLLGPVLGVAVAAGAVIWAI